MDWTRAIDGYCERTDPSLWSEPVNAVTNLAFLAMAWMMWHRSQGQAGGRVLSVILGVIGVGSLLFHTFAEAWAAMADSLPILVFTLVYIFVANRRFLGWPVWGAALGAGAYIAWTAALTPLFDALPFFTVSDYYWPLPALILPYGFYLRRETPETGRNLIIGAAILSLSLTFRSLDMEVCGSFPLGTHFMWHLLNALMLGWMIETWLRHGDREPASS